MARKAAARHGWNLDLTPCAKGSGGGPSGGVGVLVRRHFGLRRLSVSDDYVHIPYTERMGFWVTSGGGPGGCILASVYLRTSEEDGEHNQRLLYQIGGALRAADKPFIVGADWQMEPDTLMGTGWTASVAGIIRRAHRPTCVKESSAREIDYFLVHRRYGEGEATVLDQVDIRTHRPVRLRLRGRPPGLMVTEIRKPRAFPTTQIVGPMFPTPDWTGPRQGALEASSAAELDEACRNWLERYETEMIQHFGIADEMQFRGRSTPVHERFRQLPAEKKSAGDVRVKATEVHWNWLADRVREWKHLRDRGSQGASRHARQLAIRLRKYKPPFEVTDDPRWSAWRRQVRKLDAMSDAEIEGLRDHLLAHAKKAEARAARARYRGWSDWARDSTGQEGARRAFRWIREEPPWQSASAHEVNGACNRQQEADKQAEPWHKIWEVGEGLEPLRWEPELPEIDTPDAEELRLTAHSFPKNTALGCEAVHPRHLTFLSEDGLMALIALWKAMLRLGQIPRTISLLITILIPKPVKGLRPVGLFPGMLRPLTRWTRNIVGNAWAASNARPYIYGVTGASCETCVWRQAAAAEYADSKGLTAISILFDLTKAYEHLRFDLLAARAAQLGFPRELLRLLLSFYSMDRVIVLDSVATAPIQPQRGVFAGCSFADLMMRIVVITTLDPVIARWPSARLANVVDDIQVQSIGPMAYAVRVAQGVARGLKFELDRAKMAVNEEKLMLLANTKEAADELARKVPFLSKAVVRAARNLGVDFTCGRRGAAAAGVRRARLQKVKKKISKVRWIRRQGPRVQRLVSGSLLPSGSWGGGASAMPWSHVQKLRRAMHVAMYRHTAGRSATIDLALSTRRTSIGVIDPAYTATADPIVMLHSAIWDEWLPRDWIVHTMSEAVKRQSEATKPWSSVNGPISGAIACCNRIGWKFEASSPVTRIRTRTGQVLDMIDVCPMTTKTVAFRDTESWMLNRVVESHGFLDGLQHQPYLTPVQRLCLSKTAENWTCLHQGYARAIGANGIWSQERLFLEGYAEEGVCQACGDEGSLWHTFWDCPATRAFREAYGLPDGMIKMAKRTRGMPLWTHGLIEDPRVWLPNPRMIDVYRWESVPPDGLLEGTIFGDGSAFHSQDDIMRRAGWGVVMVRIERDTVHIIAEAYGVLPGFAQVTPAAEAMALLFFLRHAGVPPHTFYSDCQWVIDTFRGGPQNSTGSQHVHADIWREVWKRVEVVGPELLTLRKVKAHATLADVDAGRISGPERLANGLADKAAKKGAALHPRDEAAMERIQHVAELVPIVVKFQARLMAACGRVTLQPYKEGRKRRAGGNANIRAARAAARRRGHVVTRWGSRVRCSRCLKSARSPTYLKLMNCMSKGEQTHRLWMSDGTTFCAACGGHSRVKTYLLSRSCRGNPTPAGRRALARLWAGEFVWPSGSAAFDACIAEFEPRGVGGSSMHVDDIERQDPDWNVAPVISENP